MELSEVAFYKLKSRILEIQIQESQLQQLRQVIDQKRVLTFADAGLDSSKTYQLDDDTLSVIEKE